MQMDRKNCRRLWEVLSLAILGLLATASPLDARRLDLAEAATTQFNCIFSTDPRDPVGCSIPIEGDLSSEFSVPGFSGEAFLQSRTLRPGTPGTRGNGQRPYEYKFSLLDVTGSGTGPCVSRLTVPFFEYTRLDYDEDLADDDAWVLRRGSPGGILSFGTPPTRVERIAETVSFIFGTPVCPGGASQFAGLVSPHPAATVMAEVSLTNGDVLELEVLAPGLPDGWPPPPPPCEVSRFPDPVPIPSFVPLCRCLQDELARAFRCGILMPNLVLEREIPWPIPRGESFSAKWKMTPLRPLEGDVSITENLPKGVEAPNQQTRITFPQATPVDQTVEMEVALSSSDAVGKVASSATVEFADGTGEISSLGFNVEQGKEPEQPGGLTAAGGFLIALGILLVIALLLRRKRR